VPASGQPGGHGEEGGGWRSEQARPADDHQVTRERRFERDWNGPLRGGQRGQCLGHDRRPGSGQDERQDGLALAGLDGDHRPDACPAESRIQQATSGTARWRDDQRDIGQVRRP